MRLTRIELEGYRGFDAATFDLTHPDGGPLPIAAIVGPNGSGKSSVLKAVASALTAQWPNYGGPALGPGDMRAASARISLGVEDHLADETLAFDLVTTGTRAGWKSQSAAPQLRWHDALSADERSATGLAVAFDAHRLLPPIDVECENPQRVTATSRGSALAPSIRRDRTMGFRFAHLEQWIVNLDHLRARARADRGAAFPMWDLLKEGLDQILAPVRFEGVTEDLRVMFGTPTGSVPLDALSDGYQSVFVIVAELLLRLSLASGDPYAALDQQALCLIDEIDAHLHPRWQSQIVRGLQRLFPRVQFIVATHSPFVVASLEPHEVFRLGDIDP